jgi:hypothetical protein
LDLTLVDDLNNTTKRDDVSVVVVQNKIENVIVNMPSNLNNVSQTTVSKNQQQGNFLFILIII